MMSRKVIFTIVGFLLTISAFAEDLEGPEAFSLVVGPRIGGSYSMDTPENFTSNVQSL